MKYTPRIYAKALIEALATVPDEAHSAIIKRFLASVRRRGDARHIPMIVDAVRDSERSRVGGRLVEVAFARRHKKSVLDAFRVLFGKHDDIVFRTEPELVAGLRVTIDGAREFDHSAARRIKKLFR